MSRLLDAAARIRALTKGLERRLSADGQTGQHFFVDGTEYLFLGAQRRGYQDVPGLFRFLIENCAVSPIVLAETVNDMRVTSLRDALRAIEDPEKREAALEELDAHRIAVGARGEPRFQAATTYVK